MNILFVGEKDFQSPYSGRDFVQFGKTKSVLNKRVKSYPLIQPTFGSFLSNYANIRIRIQESARLAQ